MFGRCVVGNSGQNVRSASVRILIITNTEIQNFKQIKPAHHQETGGSQGRSLPRDFPQYWSELHHQRRRDRGVRRCEGRHHPRRLHGGRDSSPFRQRRSGRSDGNICSQSGGRHQDQVSALVRLLDSH